MSAASTCTYSSHSPTLVPHPQLNAYRFELSEQWLGDYSTHLSLAYFESEESFYVVAEEEFVYDGTPVARVSTGIQATQSTLVSNLGPLAPANVRSQSLSETEQTFSYIASFFDSNSNPIAYEMVHIKVDSTFLKNPSKLRVDGRQITPNSSERDIVWLERFTDGQGRVKIDVENSSPKLWEKLQITSQMRGFESHLANRGGFIETLTWVPSKRTLSMEVTPSGNDLLVRLVLSGPTEFGGNIPLAMLSSGKNVLFQDSVLRLSGMTTGGGPYGTFTAATYLRMRIGSSASGSEAIGVSVRFAGEIYTTSALVQFEGKTGKLQVATTDSSNMQSPEISLTGHRSFWTATIKNAKSKNVTIKAGGRWFKVVPSSDNFVITRKSNSGSQLPVSVYVDGALVVSQTIQVR